MKFSEALAHSWGDIAKVARATGVSRSTIKAGLNELEGLHATTGHSTDPGRSGCEKAHAQC